MPIKPVIDFSEMTFFFVRSFLHYVAKSESKFRKAWILGFLLKENLLSVVSISEYPKDLIFVLNLADMQN